MWCTYTSRHYISVIDACQTEPSDTHHAIHNTQESSHHDCVDAGTNVGCAHHCWLIFSPVSFVLEHIAIEGTQCTGARVSCLSSVRTMCPSTGNQPTAFVIKAACNTLSSPTNYTVTV